MTVVRCIWPRAKIYTLCMYVYTARLWLQRRAVMLSDEPNNRIGHIEVIDVSFSFEMLNVKKLRFIRCVRESAIELFCWLNQFMKLSNWWKCHFETITHKKMPNIYKPHRRHCVFRRNYIATQQYASVEHKFTSLN